jgi:hypothetical protein
MQKALEEHDGGWGFPEGSVVEAAE